MRHTSLTVNLIPCPKTSPYTTASTGRCRFCGKMQMRGARHTHSLPLELCPWAKHEWQKRGNHKAARTQQVQNLTAHWITDSVQLPLHTIAAVFCPPSAVLSEIHRQTVEARLSPAIRGPETFLGHKRHCADANKPPSPTPLLTNNCRCLCPACGMPPHHENSSLRRTADLRPAPKTVRDVRHSPGEGERGLVPSGSSPTATQPDTRTGGGGDQIKKQTNANQRTPEQGGGGDQIKKQTNANQRTPEQGGGGDQIKKQTNANQRTPERGGGGLKRRRLPSYDLHGSIQRR